MRDRDDHRYREAMQLFPHRDPATVTVATIDAVVWASDGRWHFRYLVEGVRDLVLPEYRLTGRADELWKRTCFEAFVGLAGTAYLEFNFSPSGQWAAYRFDDHRDGMRDEPAEVDVWLEGGETWVAVEAAVRCAALTDDAPLGLSAVIEERAEKSYWALAHPDGAPDFHDRACFTARLADIAHS